MGILSDLAFGLGFVVVVMFSTTVHECGHYLAAKLAGLPVLRVKINGGRTLFLWECGGTLFRLGWMPTGGIVAVYSRQLLDRLRQHPDEELLRLIASRPELNDSLADQVSESHGRLALLLIGGPLMEMAFLLPVVGILNLMDKEQMFLRGAGNAAWLMFVLCLGNLLPIGVKPLILDGFQLIEQFTLWLAAARKERLHRKKIRFLLAVCLLPIAVAAVIYLLSPLWAANPWAS